MPSSRRGAQHRGPLACTGSLGKVADLSLAHAWKWGPHTHRDPTHRPARAPGSPSAQPLEFGLKAAAPGCHRLPITWAGPLGVVPLWAAGPALTSGHKVRTVLPQSKPSPVSGLICLLHLQGVSQCLSLSLVFKPAPPPGRGAGAKEPNGRRQGTPCSPGSRCHLGPFDYLLSVLWALLNLFLQTPRGLLASPLHVSPRPGAAPSLPHVASSVAALLLSFVGANSSS